MVRIRNCLPAMHAVRTCSSAKMVIWECSTWLQSTKQLTPLPWHTPWSPSSKRLALNSLECHSSQKNGKAHINFNEEAHDNFRKAVNELSAAEAKDEGKARELLPDEMDEQFIEESPSLNFDSIKKFLPNATLHSTDKPHSCKRMLSRVLFVGFHN